MKKIIFVLAFCISISSYSKDQENNNECKIDVTSESEILNLPLDVFDSEEKGWRRFSLMGCYAEAVQIIDKYNDKNGATYRTNFHQAQLQLYLEHYPEAKALLYKSLRADLPIDSTFKWNEYVLGHVAFIDKDKPSLDFYISKLQQYNSDIRNQMNIKLLIKMSNKLDSPYPSIFSFPKK